MEKVKAKYLVTKEQAILAGMSEHGEQEVIVDPVTLTQEQRREFARSCDKSLTDTYYLPEWRESPHFRNVQDTQCPNVAGVDPQEAVKIILDWRLAVRAKHAELKVQKQAEQEMKIAELAQKGPEEILYKGVCRWHTRIPYDLPSDHPTLLALKQKAQVIADQRNAKIKEEEHAKAEAAAQKRAAEQAKINAKQERRSTQIKSWVDAHGTDSQKKRLAVNLLPHDEIINAIRDEAFEPLADLERFTKIKSGDFCTCDYEEDRDVYYDVEDCKTATEEEYNVIEAIKAALPEATVTLRKHTGSCSGCEQTTTKKSILVELTVGEFEFSRAYAV